MSVGSVGGVGTSVQTSTDPRDLNHDGKVTEAEIQAYDLAHPKPKKAEATASQTAGQDSGTHLAGEPRLLDLQA